MMNAKEEKFRDEYLKYRQKYGAREFPDDIWLKLGDLRKSLGMSWKESDTIIRQADKLRTVRRARVAEKIEMRLDVSNLQNETSLAENPVFADLINEISQYEAVVNEILEASAAVSEKCSELQNDMNQIGGSLAEYGIKVMSRSRKLGMATLGVGAAVVAGAYLYNAWKQFEMKQQVDRQMLDLLEKKKEMANAKYDALAELKDKLKTGRAKYEQLYQSEFDKEVEWESPLRDKMVKQFKMAFILVMKRRYLDAILDFVLCEMAAWKAGRQESNSLLPTWDSIIDLAICEWVPKLTRQDFNPEKWDAYLLDMISVERGKYPLPIYLLFMEPYFLRNYAGVTLLDLPNGSEGLLQEIKDLTLDYVHAENEARQRVCKPIEEMLSHNAYYIDCKKFIPLYKVYPKHFGWSDVVSMMIYCGITGIIAYYIWKSTNGLLFAFLSLLFCCVWAFVAKAVSEGIPYINRYQQYLEQVREVQSQELLLAKKYSDIKM